MYVFGGKEFVLGVSEVFLERTGKICAFRPAECAQHSREFVCSGMSSLALLFRQGTLIGGITGLRYQFDPGIDLGPVLFPELGQHLLKLFLRVHERPRIAESCGDCQLLLRMHVAGPVAFSAHLSVPALNI